MTVIHYRSASIPDIQKIIPLRVLMQKEVNEVTGHDRDHEYEILLHEYFHKSLENGSYYAPIAELDGKVIAAGGVVFYEKPPSITSFKGLVGYVTNVYTLPEYRGQGIAFKLTDMIIQEARSRKAVKLHLGSTKLSHGVYLKAGFKVSEDVLEFKV